MLLIFAGDAIQLVPDGTLVFHLVMVILMVALLNATLLKPINRILADRDRRTRGRLSEAEVTMAEVDKKLRDYERQLREARAEGYSLMDRERQVVSAERDRRVAEVRTQIGREVTAEKEKLKLEAELIRGELMTEANDIAVAISRQILHRPVGQTRPKIGFEL